MAWSDELGLPGEVRWVPEPGAAIPAPPGGWQEGVQYDIQGQQSEYQLGALIPWVAKKVITPPVIGGIAGAIGGMLFGDGNGAPGAVEQQVGLPFVPAGPGVPEPPAAMVSKAWRIRVNSGGINEWWVFFWRLLDGRTVMYNPMKRQWKMWRDYKSIVIGKSITTSNAKRTAKRFKQHVKALSTVMRIVR